MSLTITTSPPSIVVTDTDNSVILNTSEKLFYARQADYITGSVTVGVDANGVNLNTGASAGNFQKTHTLGIADPYATFVRGAMKVTQYSTIGQTFQGVPTGIWINVSGTYVAAYSLQIMHMLTFVNNAGSVQLLEQLVSGQQTAFVGGQTLQIASAIIEYRLLCGQFT